MPRGVKREKGSTSRNHEVDLRAVKREHVNRRSTVEEEEEVDLRANTNEEEGDEVVDLRAVKREHVNRRRHETGDDDDDVEVENLTTQQKTSDRRALRSRYLLMKNRINDERDDLTRIDSAKFSSFITEVENLHQHVLKPREQVADAEALLDIANSLVTSVKSQSNDGLTPAAFVDCLLKQFGSVAGGSTAAENAYNSLRWKDVGRSVSHIFLKVHGCSTMLGPMNTEMKQRKVTVHRKRTKPTESSRPEELNDSGEDERTDTDKNMAVMFDILRRRKRVKLESLMLNRNSFAQTVENLFALSFLVKDGRAEIVVDENGSQFVSPRNAPDAKLVQSGDVSYDHFVFRFDFADWKLIMDLVPVGEELMPHREHSNDTGYSQADPVVGSSQADHEAENSQANYNRTPIKKFSRNRGLIIQEDSVVEDSPENGGDNTTATARANGIRRCKRKLN